MARITVINDSSEFLDLMRELVTSLGHQMAGLEAVHTSIEEVVRTKPDLLLVDLRLENTPQEVSGWELVILAKAHHDLLNVPVILCTADVWELKKRTRDLEQIADVHVRTKPFQIDDMSELIERLLKTSRTKRTSRAKSAISQIPVDGGPPGPPPLRR
ncbi:MAG: response regulator [Chloroflexi bacterium]|nr:MAG: response regulator [Chloroflexota bacterium]